MCIRDSSLAKKNYQNLEGINSLDVVIMFCPNEAAISSLGNSSRKMMDYAIQKKITLVGPSMLYFTLKTVEYYWKAEKQSKNTQKIIDLANKISSQSIEIYESAKIARDSIQKTSSGVDDVMRKIKDGRGVCKGMATAFRVSQEKSSISSTQERSHGRGHDRR